VEWFNYGMSQAPTTISYQVLLDALPEAALVLDEAFCIIASNSTFLALVRQKAEDIEGRALVELVPDAAPLLSRLKQAPKSREEAMLLGRFFETTLAPLKDAEGASLLLLYDKTVSKLHEQALLSQEQRYRALFEHSNDAIFILETDLTIVIANEQAAFLLEDDLARMLQRNLLLYIPKAEQSLFQVYVGHLLKDEIVPLYETHLLDTQFELLPVEVSLTLVRDNQRQPLHIQVIARDIQERRRAEMAMEIRLEQLDSLRRVEEELNSSLDIQIVIKKALDKVMELSHADAGFIALSVNERFSVSHVAGAYFPAVIGSPINYRLGVVGRVLEHHEAYFIRNVREDPYYFEDIPATQSLMAFPLISQERLVGILNLEGFAQDSFNDAIFDFVQVLASRVAVAIDNARLYEFVRKQLDELSALYNELHEAEKLKTDMMRIANHDLKNPLSIVRGYVDLLLFEGDRLPNDAKTYLRSMQESLERAEQILHDFLSAEAISSRAERENLRFNLRDLVERALGEFRPQAKEKGLLLEHVFDVEAALVRGDEVQLYEAIANLISNAIKYTPKDGNVLVELTLDDYRNVTFRVKDTGYGIPAERQARLFEPFYRPKTAETAHIEGTGLGLHLVKNIVERHHGEMLFESVYHQGSSFGFLLPFANKE
jgi:PAS domain S-box-containing protein